MSLKHKKYSPPRSRNLYTPDSVKPYALSRSKIENFVRCPRCFYLDRRLGVDVPPGYPFNLNNAVDSLFKKEFDRYRDLGEPHPLMKHSGVDAVPFAHPDIDTWRENFAGIRHLDTDTNFLVTGAVDDVWITPAGALLVVDYKATSREGDVRINESWQGGYHRQIEIYQWLFRANGFAVSDTGYFVYTNGRTDLDTFEDRLLFETKLLSYVGNDGWVNAVLKKIKTCLDAPTIPSYSDNCDYCRYQEALEGAVTAPINTTLF